MTRVLVLPTRGRLIVATDLHGHLRDFRAVVAHFQSRADAHLVICGDLVHGPAIPREQWPDHLGDYYADQTVELLDEAYALQQRFDGRVHFLLGNHEHAHLGGPRLDKFHPDEAAHLERCYPVGAFERVRHWMAAWPVAALAPAAGIVMTHAAPHARITDPADLDAVALDGYELTPLHEMPAAGPLGALLWARTTTTERAEAFLHALHPDARVAVFGHDPIREGYVVEREPLLCLSTSFALRDADKVYLEWDLATPAPSAAGLAAAGIRPLYGPA